MVVFDRCFFREHQSSLLSILNGPVGTIFRNSLSISERYPIMGITPNSVHFRLPNGKIRAVLYSSNQFSREVHRKYKTLWEIIHAWDMNIANRLAPSLNLGFDTYTSQPDETSGNDSYIDNGLVNTNYGTSAQISIGRRNDGDPHRGLIKFDFSSIPTGATVSSATLSLWHSQDNSDSNCNIILLPLKRNWVESQCTWNLFSSGNNWGTAGASNTTTDTEATAVATRAFTSTESVGEKQWSLTTAKVKEQIDGTIENYGYLMRVEGATENSVSNYYFRSSSHGTAGERPKMVIEYSLSSNNGNFLLFM